MPGPFKTIEERVAYYEDLARRVELAAEELQEHPELFESHPCRDDIVGYMNRAAIAMRDAVLAIIG